MQHVIFRQLGRIRFCDAWQLQEQLLTEIAEKRKLGIDQNDPLHYFLLCEHEPVFTLGKSGKPDHLLASPQLLNNKGIEFYHINRGGDITFHGPGQWVGYPILDLDYFFHDIHRYVNYLEETIILTLKEFGIRGERIKGQTGVWIDTTQPATARKICAFGVRCSRWITMHGFALNVNTSLENFNLIVPCGIRDKSVTSMQNELGKEVNMHQVEESIKRNFEKVFNCIITKSDKIEI
ncbi:MAG: lipoyl(octanoyl) transferase LipB [Bacteroidia bacterium]|nr:lipoyl(octanoyl) transferase LipB [Bacteroidia bacterium]MCZ2276555.1 lipoyl(octanoyl) transferase LipB [Bacteroidia bacterium]